MPDSRNPFEVHYYVRMSHLSDSMTSIVQFGQCCSRSYPEAGRDLQDGWEGHLLVRRSMLYISVHWLSLMLMARKRAEKQLGI